LGLARREIFLQIGLDGANQLDCKGGFSLYPQRETGLSIGLDQAEIPFSATSDSNHVHFWDGAEPPDAIGETQGEASKHSPGRTP
jgi:hypothetical protein